jgi:hypothetical protein
MTTNYGPELNDGKNIFVFGSNLAGRHEAGAALRARLHWGAVNGWGWGLHGQSFGIPTKSAFMKALPLIRINKHVGGFLDYARKHPELTFLVTRIGCGLAGYKDGEISPMFRSAPENCILPKEWA